MSEKVIREGGSTVSMPRIHLPREDLRGAVLVRIDGLEVSRGASLEGGA